VAKHDLSSLRVLGSVGEPINPEAWRWYNKVVGKGKCSIVDTYWQTERLVTRPPLSHAHKVTRLQGYIVFSPHALKGEY